VTSPFSLLADKFSSGSMKPLHEIAGAVLRATNDEVVATIQKALNEILVRLDAAFTSG
jgi:hypothetical protein